MAAEPTKDYAFIMNLKALPAQNIELIDGYELRRATPNEIVEITSLIENFSSDPVPRASLWEYIMPPIGPYIRLPERQWRYFVVTFTSQPEFVKIQQVFDICPVELEVGLTIHHGGALRGWGVNPDRLIQFLNAARHNDEYFLTPAQADIAEIASINDRWQAYDHAVLNLKPYLNQLHQLKLLPHYSPLRFLGYFGLLESLLTHQPKPEDPYDSITRQVKNKLTLLDHRWSRPIDYSPFGGAAPDKVWTVMYHYRSKVAHGGEPDFRTTLKLLRSPDNALRLIKETTKAVIRHAVQEPQLIVDLKCC